MKLCLVACGSEASQLSVKRLGGGSEIFDADGAGDIQVVFEQAQMPADEFEARRLGRELQDEVAVPIPAPADDGPAHPLGQLGNVRRAVDGCLNELRRIVERHRGELFQNAIGSDLCPLRAGVLGF